MKTKWTRIYHSGSVTDRVLSYLKPSAPKSETPDLTFIPRPLTSKPGMVYIKSIQGQYDYTKCTEFRTPRGTVALVHQGPPTTLGYHPSTRATILEHKPPYPQVPVAKGRRRSDRVRAKVDEPGNPLWLAESEFTGAISRVLGASTWVLNRTECFTLKFVKFRRRKAETQFLPITGFGYAMLRRVCDIIEGASECMKVYVMRQKPKKNAFPVGLVRTATSAYLSVPELHHATKNLRFIPGTDLKPEIIPTHVDGDKVLEFVVRIKTASFRKSIEAAIRFLARALADLASAGFKNPV